MHDFFFVQKMLQWSTKPHVIKLLPQWWQHLSELSLCELRENHIFFFHFSVVCCGHNFHAHFSLLNQLQVSLSQNLCSWVSQLEQGKEILTCLFEGRLWIYGVNNSINFNKLWFKLSFVTAGSKSLFFLSRLF